MFMLLAKPIIFMQKKDHKYVALKNITFLFFIPVYIIDFFFIMYYLTHKTEIQWWYFLYCIRYSNHLIKLVISSVFWDLIAEMFNQIGQDHYSL